MVLAVTVLVFITAWVKGDALVAALNLPSWWVLALTLSAGVFALLAYGVWRLAGPAEFPVAGLGLTVARRLAGGRHGGPDPAA